MSNLNSCQELLKKWSKREFPNNALLLERLRGQLARVSNGTITEESSKAIRDVKLELERILELEEGFWW